MLIYVEFDAVLNFMQYLFSMYLIVGYLYCFKKNKNFRTLNSDHETTDLLSFPVLVEALEQHFGTIQLCREVFFTR